MICEELKLSYEKISGAGCYDSLTGLVNYGFLCLFLDQEFKRAKRYHTPCSLLMIDIDAFADYNGRHGHVEGDRILHELAGVIGNSVRETDLPAHYAGDKFMVLLTDTPASQAKVLAERIQQRVGKHFGGSLTIGIGISTLSEATVTPRELIKNADAALAKAKLQGKNHLYLCGEAVPPAEQPEQTQILVVDDDPVNVKLLAACLTPAGYGVHGAFSGDEALRFIDRQGADLVLLDVMMPGINGYDVCRSIKGNERTRMIPVVMITALDDRDSRIKAIEAGADDFITKPPNKLELLTRTKSLVRLKQINSRLINIESVLFSLANAVEAKDSCTQNHTRRVSELAVALGKGMALGQRDIEALHLGGILHDIGKIGIPDEILNKPGRLTAEEWAVIKTHPEVGYRICQPLKATLGGALDVIRHHHEKLNGSGYPDGLQGGEISVVARIMSVVDIFDALTSTRPYHSQMSAEEAVNILYQNVAKDLLDGEIVDRLAELVRRNRSGKEEEAWDGEQANPRG